jgi:hypothetical protein
MRREKQETLIHQGLDEGLVGDEILYLNPQNNIGVEIRGWLELHLGPLILHI